MSGSRQPDPGPTVHLFAGLNGAGKTTLARRLAADLPGVRFSLDEWMLRLYGLAYDHPDYPERAADCRELIWDLAQQVLQTGAPVLLDWNLWDRARRREWADRSVRAGYVPLLHYLRTPVEVATQRTGARRDPASHVLGAGDVAHLATLFEAPRADEGIEIDLC